MHCMLVNQLSQKERQVLSIDSQVKEMLQLAERDGLEVVEIRRESNIQRIRSTTCI